MLQAGFYNLDCMDGIIWRIEMTSKTEGTKNKEAAKVLDCAWRGLDWKTTMNINEAYALAIKDLRGPVPDPSTGLVPCGCGGKAQVWPSDPTQFTKTITDYEVGCTECAMTTGWVRGKQENAMKVWNTAMGYKEDENE